MPDPRTALAGWVYGDLGHGDVGRKTMWSEPDTGFTQMGDDEDMALAWPDFTPEEWDRMRHVAYHRGRVHRIKEDLARSPAERQHLRQEARDYVLAYMDKRGIATKPESDKVDLIVEDRLPGASRQELEAAERGLQRAIREAAERDASSLPRYPPPSLVPRNGRWVVNLDDVTNQRHYS
jgi:hypothetical protein